MHDIWNPWHGCHKCSEGCLNCYFYYLDGKGFYAGSNYGLIIANTDDSILYWREVGQDPHTEWLINCLAGDSENTEVNPVFTGEPVTF